MERYIILGADGAVLRSYPQVSGLCCFSMFHWIDRMKPAGKGSGSQKNTDWNANCCNAPCCFMQFSPRVCSLCCCLCSKGAEDSEELGATFKLVANRAVHVVRDLDPSDSLNFVRLRTANKELMIGVDNDYTVIIQQKWAPAAI